MSDIVNEMAADSGLADRDMLAARSRVMAALGSEFSGVDSGVGAGYCYFWVRHGDVEYRLTMVPVRSLKVAS